LPDNISPEQKEKIEEAFKRAKQQERDREKKLDQVTADNAPITQALGAAPEGMAAGTNAQTAPADVSTVDVSTGASPLAEAGGVIADDVASAPSGEADVQGTLSLPEGVSMAADAVPPSEAELAIVQNAEVVAQMADSSAPVAGSLSGAEATLEAVPDVDVTPALIRPLPKEYLVVKKEHEANDVDARLTAARRALTNDNNMAALQLFTELEQDYPKDSRVLMGRAVALQRLGQKEDALAAYEGVLINHPKNLEALTNMLGLLKAQDPQLAVDKLNELRKVYPSNADVTAQLGIAYGTQMKYDEALKYLSMADALQPGSANITFNRAVVLDKMGRRIEASDAYRRILSMAQNNALDQPVPLDAIRQRLAVMQ
jgi:tetratricopeptide (TPR) repeat protein